MTDIFILTLYSQKCPHLITYLLLPLLYFLWLEVNELSTYQLCSFARLRHLLIAKLDKAGTVNYTNISNLILWVSS